MQIGVFEVELLSEGRFEMFPDGHINRMPESSQNRSQPQKAAEAQSNIVGINPVLVQTPDHNILLDTGLGWGLDAGSEYSDVSNICTNLAIFGLQPDDVTHVILSHLHYDHAAGSSFTGSDITTKPTFPNARYFVHQAEWNHALGTINPDQSQSENGTSYQLDELYRLVSDKDIEFITGDSTEILPGVTAIQTGGHTPGHQIVQLESEDDRAYYLGDLVPSSAHLNQYSMRAVDVNAVKTKKEKVRLLKKACQEKAVLFFYHSKHGQAGSLIRDEDEQYVLAELSNS